MSKIKSVPKRDREIKIDPKIIKKIPEISLEVSFILTRKLVWVF